MRIDNDTASYYYSTSGECALHRLSTVPSLPLSRTLVSLHTTRWALPSPLSPCMLLQAAVPRPPPLLHSPLYLHRVGKQSLPTTL